jgi:hypothetical protein
MKEQKVFIKVTVSETHVGKISMFLTAVGEEVFGVCHLDNCSLKWIVKDWRGDDVHVTHTIEEIELPSEEEVTKSYLDYKGFINNPALWGANFILNKLKGGTK